MAVSLERVAQLALALPGVSESESRGRRTWSVAGRSFAWERPFSKADLTRFGDEPVPAGDILGIRTADLEEKEALLAAHPGCAFTISHFDGHAAILVQLRNVRVPELRTLLEDGWLARAPADLAATLGR